VRGHLLDEVAGVGDVAEVRAGDEGAGDGERRQVARTTTPMRAGRSWWASTACGAEAVVGGDGRRQLQTSTATPMAAAERMAARLLKPATKGAEIVGREWTGTAKGRAKTRSAVRRQTARQASAELGAWLQPGWSKGACGFVGLLVCGSGAAWTGRGSK